MEQQLPLVERPVECPELLEYTVVEELHVELLAVKVAEDGPEVAKGVKVCPPKGLEVDEGGPSRGGPEQSRRRDDRSGRPPGVRLELPVEELV